MSFTNMVDTRLAFIESVATLDGSNQTMLSRLGDQFVTTVRHKAAFTRGMSFEEATVLIRKFAVSHLNERQKNACGEAITAMMERSDTSLGTSLAVPTVVVPGAVPTSSGPPSAVLAGQAVPAFVTPSAGPASSVSGGQAVPAVLPPPTGAGIGHAVQANVVTMETGSSAAGQICKHHYNYWRPEQWNRFQSNNPAPPMEDLVEILIDVALQIGCTNPCEPTMASMTGLAWGQFKIRGHIMPPDWGYKALQLFKKRLLDRRPANIDRAALIKVFPETPAFFAPEWRAAVYGDAAWRHYICPFDPAHLARSLEAVPCRGNNRMLAEFRSGGAVPGRLALTGPAVAYAQPHPALVDFAQKPQTQAEVLGNVVLGILHERGGTASQLERIIRNAVGSPRREQGGDDIDISVVGFSKRSPPKEKQALLDGSAASSGSEAVTPGQAGPSAGAVTPPSGSALGSPGAGGLSEQAGPLGRNLLLWANSKLDMRKHCLTL